MVGAGDAHRPGLVHDAPGPRAQHVVQPHEWRVAAVGRPGEAGPVPPPRDIGAVHEAGPEQVAEHAVIPAGVEVPGHQVRAVHFGQRRPDPLQILLPPLILPVHRGRRVHHGHCDRLARGRLDEGPRRRVLEVRHRGQRGHRPARPQAAARRPGTRVGVAERQHPGYPGPLQPAQPARGHLLHGQDVHLVLPQAAQHGVRAGPATLHVQRQHPQPARGTGKTSGTGKSGAAGTWGLGGGPAGRALPAGQDQRRDQQRQQQPPGGERGYGRPGDGQHRAHRGERGQFRARARPGAAARAGGQRRQRGHGQYQGHQPGCRGPHLNSSTGGCIQLRARVIQRPRLAAAHLRYGRPAPVIRSWPGALGVAAT